jgi:dTDP-glucose 4,6-dehydratase
VSVEILLNTLRGTRVLVTGAGGFIGSRLCERLIETGAQVRALVRYTSDGEAGWLDRSPLRGEIDLKRGDLADRDSVYDAVRDRELVFHLGALIAIPYSYLAPESYVRTNILGTLNILQAVRELGVGRLVHTSTSEVYGSAQFVPMTEAHPLVGQSPYSASKIAADKLAESYHRSFGTPVVTLRPFNTFGPRQSARAVIPAIAVQLLAGGGGQTGRHAADAGLRLRRRHGRRLPAGRSRPRDRGSHDPHRRRARDRHRRPAGHDRRGSRTAGGGRNGCPADAAGGQ